jgi:hypothetical protein
MIAACEEPDELSCEAKAALELSYATRQWQQFCDGDASINDILRLFVLPPWVTNQPDQRAALVKYLTLHEICLPTNNAAQECVACEEPIQTGCPDPEQCPSKFYGFGMLEVIKASIRSNSMAVVPFASLDEVEAGEALVWDPAVYPDNVNCDPCGTNAAGAFVPQHVYDENHPGG